MVEYDFQSTSAANRLSKCGPRLLSVLSMETDCPIIPPIPHVSKATLQRTQLHVLSSSTDTFRKSADFFLHCTILGKLFLQTLKIMLFICGTVH